MVCVHVCVCAAQCHVLPLAICTCCSLPLNHTGRTWRATWRLPTQHGYLAEFCLSSETHAHRHVFLPLYLDLMNNKCCSLNVLDCISVSSQNQPTFSLCSLWVFAWGRCHVGLYRWQRRHVVMTKMSSTCLDRCTAHWTVTGVFGPSSIHRGESGNLHKSEVRHRSRWCIINGYFISTRNQLFFCQLGSAKTSCECNTGKRSPF